jgi:hypothetical protein
MVDTAETSPLERVTPPTTLDLVFELVAIVPSNKVTPPMELEDAGGDVSTPW